VWDIQILYLLAIAICGFPVLDELKRIIQLAKAEKIKGAKKAT